MTARSALLGLLSLPFAAGCVNMPTPLAPNLTGSVGAPNFGVLTDGVELPEAGLGFVRYRPKSPHYWGRPRLVSAVEAAAGDILHARPEGGRLVIGDLSGPSGGRIPGHDSHRTGRDVDLLFYVTTPEGTPRESPGFVHFEADGMARIPDSTEYVRFDVEREWMLVRALLGSPQIDVQFMFISREMEALLIDYARARGEPDELVWHAETVMLEPSDSTRHDDHLHLRIACRGDEAVSGCTGGGPRWDWLPELPAPLKVDLSQIAREDPLEPPAALAGSSQPLGGG